MTKKWEKITVPVRNRDALKQKDSKSTLEPNRPRWVDKAMYRLVPAVSSPLHLRSYKIQAKKLISFALKLSKQALELNQYK
jgi:hypothetical protein